MIEKELRISWDADKRRIRNNTFPHLLKLSSSVPDTGWKQQQRQEFLPLRIQKQYDILLVVTFGRDILVEFMEAHVQAPMGTNLCARCVYLYQRSIQANSGVV